MKSMQKRMKEQKQKQKKQNQHKWVSECRHPFLYFEYIEKLKINGIIKLGQIIKTVI